MFSKKITPMVPALMALMMILSCAKITGTFALKYPTEDSYRRVREAVEIEKNSQVQWVFKLDKVLTNKTPIGVILLKKELVWVDVLVQSVTVGPDNEIVYGTIKDLEEGDYKIMLTDVKKGREIDELEFTIYSDEEFE
jgi:hypothetical protein